MTDVAVPGLAPRLDRVERRQDLTETTVASHGVTIAVHTEQIANSREDIAAVGQVFKESSAATNARIDGLIRAVWAAVVLLVPTAISLVALVIQN